MQKINQISFLKAVFQHSITAFGGPQVALGLMQHRFVEQRKDLSAEELLEYNAFCQLLPGASSTQTIVLIGYKLGGLPLAFATLLVWVLPAFVIMTCFALLFSNFNVSGLLKALVFLPPMAVGFIASATLLFYKKAVNNLITKWIFLLAAAITFVGFNTPWTIPIIIILAGVVTNISSKRIPDAGTAPKSIRWQMLILFAALFLAAGILSEQSARHQWKNKSAFALFETNYRFGSLVFGGGDVLIPMMYEQYVARPNSPHIKKNKREVITIPSEVFLTGSGLVRAVPGPIFSFASYTGAIAMREKGISWQLAGATIATLGIFLPSFIIVLFFFPIWQMLKEYAVFYRSLEGIYAAIVGIMLGAVLYLIKDITICLAPEMLSKKILFGFVFLMSTVLLYKYKSPPQWIVLFCLLVGFIFSVLN